MVFNKDMGKEDGTDTIIGPSVKVEGNFMSNGNIVIEGEVKGSIKTKKNLKVGEGAKIDANVNVSNALVSGEIKGNVKVKERLQLTKTARISGDIETKILSVAEGATLNGKCSMSATDDKVLEKEERIDSSKSIKSK